VQGDILVYKEEPPMLELYQVAIILVGIIVFAALSRRLEASIFTLPLVFTVFGWLIGQGGIQLVPMEAEHEVIQVIAEITLVLVLFSDASRVKLRELMQNYTIPAHIICL